MWEVWVRSVAPQRGSLLSLMSADRYGIRPSVVLSYCSFTSTRWMDLTGESSASVRVDHQHTKTPHRENNCGYFWCHNTCNVFCPLASREFLRVPEWLSTTPRRGSWTFPVNLWLICEMLAPSWILNILWIFSQRLWLVVVYFSYFAVNHQHFHFVWFHLWSISFWS